MAAHRGDLRPVGYDNYGADDAKVSYAENGGTTKQGAVRRKRSEALRTSRV